MKSKQLLFSSAFLVASLVGHSQSKREIIAEDPHLAPNFRVDLSPLYFITDENNTFTGYSARVSYRHNDKFTIAGEFRKEWFDYEEDQLKSNEGYDIANPAPYKGWGFDFTGTFYFAKHEKTKEEYLNIKSRSVGYHTVEVTVDPLDVTRLALYGLRGGYTVYKGTNTVDANLSEVGNPSNVKESELVIPLETRSYVFGGLSYSRIKNIAVNYPNYGKRRKQFIREIYMDVMYGTGAKAENVVDYSGTTPKTFHIDERLDERPIGARVGVLSTPTGRLINVGYGVEASMLPGNGLPSFNIKLILSLGKKLGGTEE